MLTVAGCLRGEEFGCAIPAQIGDQYPVAGIGERKLETYGRALLQVIASYRAGASSTLAPGAPSAAAAETLRMLREGHSLEEIAQSRNRTTGTIAEIVADLLQNDQAELPPGFVAEEKYRAIAAACARLGLDRLRPVKDALPSSVTFDEIRIVMADLKRRATGKLARTS